MEKPQDVQKAIDESLLWECKASAKPKPSYRWLKNGELLESFEVGDAVMCFIFSAPEEQVSRFRKYGMTLKSKSHHN